MAQEAEIKSFLFASLNHTVGMYEVENAPGIYQIHFPRRGDESPVRLDGHYGLSKAFGGLVRYYVENRPYPKQVYAYRIPYVLSPEYDHPYGPAELGGDGGEWERDDGVYEKRIHYDRLI